MSDLKLYLAKTLGIKCEVGGREEAACPGKDTQDHVLMVEIQYINFLNQGHSTCDGPGL